MAKEEALRLYWLFFNRIEHTLSEEYDKVATKIAIQLAILSVEEILKVLGRNEWYNNEIQFWNEVKIELEKL